MTVVNPVTTSMPNHVVGESPGNQRWSKFRVLTPIDIKYIIVKKNIIGEQYFPHERDFCKDRHHQGCPMHK
jgi:hypothetical protein